LTIVGLHGSYQIRGELAKGGVGKIYAIDRPDQVFKQYLDSSKAPGPSTLEPLVDVGRQIIVRDGVPVGQRPESSINWPLDVIPGAYGVEGVILPRLPGQLYDPQFGKPRGLEFLIMRRAGPPAAKVRVALLLRMAEILAYLDMRRLVHGDVSGKNLVWSAAPEPVMYLIDCDALLPQVPAPTHGVQTPGWTDPRLVERLIRAHDHRSDWYALALAMYRGLLLVPGNLRKENGIWRAPASIPDELDQRIVALLHRALAYPLDAAKRPRPQEWVDTLVEVYLPAQTAFDDNALRTLDRIAPNTPPPTRARPFVPLPPTSWSSVAPPPSPAPPPTYSPPTYPPPTYQPPSPYPPPPYPTAPPPMPYGYPPPTVPPTRDRRPGILARWAMRMGASFHAVSLLLICCPTVGVILLGITLIQLLRTPSYHSQRTGALVATGIYMGLNAFCSGFAIVLSSVPQPTSN
jgi:hypothetical protein